MNEKYKNFGNPEDNVCQEAAEVIQIIMKAKNFGWLNCHPNNPKISNAEYV